MKVVNLDAVKSALRDVGVDIDTDINKAIDKVGLEIDFVANDIEKKRSVVLEEKVRLNKIIEDASAKLFEINTKHRNEVESAVARITKLKKDKTKLKKYV